MNPQEKELHAAANRGDCAAIADLLGVRIEHPWATYRPYTEAGLEVIQRCNPRVADEDGVTALMWSSMEGSALCVEMLIPKSDLNARSKSGSTALSIAVRCMKTDCIAALIPYAIESEVMELISDSMLEKLIADRCEDASLERRSSTQYRLGSERARREQAALRSIVKTPSQPTGRSSARRSGL